MKLVIILVYVCGTIVGSNETFSNEIPEEPVPKDEPEVHVEQGNSWSNRTLKKVYENAVEAYLAEDWDGCIEGFNEALHGYRVFKRVITNCRKKCRAVASGAEPIFPENIEDLHFYEKKVRETLCLLTCNQEYREIAGSKALKRLPREVEQKFADNGLYEYLHICYYKKDRYQDAANAVFTFLVWHSDHEASIETLRHYLTLPGVEEQNVVNLEALPFITLYFKGVVAYEDEKYSEAASFFESSVMSYLQSDEECRLYCEGSFDQGWHPEFTSSVANHFTYCLKCKHACSRVLNSVNGDFRRDLFESHYNYLQFSYYKLGKMKAACAAVESYLLFAPADETMLHNKEYYRAQPQVKEEYFAPREEALKYVKRQIYERRLLRFISEEFTLIEEKFKQTFKENKEKRGKERILQTPPGHSPSFRTRLTGNLSIIRDEETEKRDRERPRVMADVNLIAGEEKLGGRNRYVADGFLNSTECQSVLQLASVAAVEGDGYDENKSPHSVHERFEGITIGRAALMAYFGQLQLEQLELLLEKTEQALEHVERYFKLDRRLYFTYTHLVCRTALPDSPANRTDLSHQVHADNCLLQPDNTCSRESPAYVWRDYSALVYLNDDFDGGEFFFAKENDPEAENRVVPRCGRMVAFSAGRENLHGVRAVLRGRRCALALWFTQDERYTEYERTLARAILKRVQTAGPIEEKGFRIPLRYEDVLIDRFNEDALLKQILSRSS